jgi:hypothetical protein
MESGALTGDAKIKEPAAGRCPPRAGTGKSLRLSLTPLRPAVDQGPHVGKGRHRQTDYPRLAIGQAGFK